MSSQEFARNESRNPGIGAASLDISALSGDTAADLSRTTVWQAKILIGPYRLIEPIGSDGMGEVWLAEQHHPVQRRIALKLIKAGMNTGEAVAAFPFRTTGPGTHGSPRNRQSVRCWCDAAGPARIS